MHVKVKVKQSLGRPGELLEVEAARFPDNWNMKAVSPTQRPLLPSRKYFWYSFLLDPVNEVDEKLQMAPPGIESAHFRLLALCLNQLRHCIDLYIPLYTSTSFT